MSGELFPHQREGAQQLLQVMSEFNGRAYLADPPGYGKTRTVIEALRRNHPLHCPLVVAPAGVVTHWRREFAVGAPGLRPTVLSYEYLTRHPGAAAGHTALVLDEAHRLRNAKAKITKLLLGKDGVARTTPVVLLASGTPMWKNPYDLWTVVSSLFPRAAVQYGLRSSSDWLNHFCRYGFNDYGLKVYGTKRPDELQALLAQFMVRRELVEVDVPIHWTTLPLDAGELHGVEAESIREALEKAEAFGVSLDEALGAAQAATYRRIVGEAKAPAVASMVLDELSGSDEKLVLMAYHHSVLDTLEAKLKPLGLVRVDGTVPSAERAARVDAFQNDPGVRIYLGQQDANREGITLTAAHRMIIVEPSWTAKANVQAGKRIARIGQRAPFTVAQMVSLAGTIDEAVVRQNENETRMEQEVFGASGRPNAGGLVR